MAATGGGKKKKGKKGQTVPLTAFLADTGYVAPPKKLNWAEESDDTRGAVVLAEEYGGPPMDLRNLPSAPRASRALDLDLSRLPSKPPYTAFLGNLPFDISEEDIRNLFRGLRVENIRFPQEQGRVKGFGYAEFFDIEQLKSALALSNEKIRNRQIRIDIADQAGKDSMSRDGNRDRGGFDDKTTGDWRRDDGPPSNDARQDDRRGGPGGFRDDRRGDYGDREPRELGPADKDDCWRRDDGPANPPSSNTWGSDRGGRGRDDAWGGRSGGGFRDDRGGGFRDDRGGGGFRDNRGGGFRDDRGGGFRDDRGGGLRDDRGGGGGFRDNRGGGFRDDRGGGFRDDRGGGFRDDRGGGGFRDNRGGGFRDDRGGGFRDDRSGGGYRDDRGGGSRDDRQPDDGPRQDEGGASEPPLERRKLNLKPRTVEPKTEATTAPAPQSSSIFGGAKPVDTATKERQIEEKMSSLHVNGDVRRNNDRDYRGRRDNSADGTRGRSQDGRWEGSRDGPRDRSRESPQEYNRGSSRPGDSSREGPREGIRNDTQERGRDGPQDRESFDDRNGDGYDRPPDYPQDRNDGDEENRDHERLPDDGYTKSGNDSYSRNTSNDKYSDTREEFRDSAGGDNGEPVDNWCDENVRHDKSRVMRADLVTEAAKGDHKQRTLSDSDDNKSREDMSVLKNPGRDDRNSRVPVKSPRGKKWDKDGPVILPKYEEPPQPVFSTASRFAALGLSDGDDDNNSDEDTNS